MKKWANGGKFSGLENFLGGKTGYTDSAGQTFAGVFSLPSAETGSPNGEASQKEIVIIILKAATATTM